jgi:tRNA U34 5-carboxymethylaminomethyl modifying GTPase MnmE/TrmE
VLWQVTLVDTAGLRQSSDEIEVQGMQRARSAMASADIVMVVLDPAAQPESATQAARLSRASNGTSPQTSHLCANSRDAERGSRSPKDQEDSEDILKELMSLSHQPPDSVLQHDGLEDAPVPGSLTAQQQRLLVVHNKCDLAPHGRNGAASCTEGGPAACSISCRTGEGLDELLDRLSGLVEATTATGESHEGAMLVTRCTAAPFRVLRTSVWLCTHLC